MGRADEERMRQLEEENTDLKEHLRTLTSGAAIVTRCWREGIFLEDIFYESLEEAVARAGAELLATEGDAEKGDAG